jgi:Glycosyl transferase 4-like domain
MPRVTWAILTGEYPPDCGGVGDYSRQLARGLAAAGDAVHVWTVPGRGSGPDDPDVHLHQLPDCFGLRSLPILSRAIRRLPRSARLLVQYVPHAFGWKAMNLPFCVWLRMQRHLPVWVMFHEVVFPLRPGQPWKHNLLGRATRIMARQLLRAAERLFVSIPGWEPLLHEISPLCLPITWLPVPSNIPDAVASTVVEETRRRIAPSTDQIILGHFGTFGKPIAAMLESVLPPLVMADNRRIGLLIGRGSTEFARKLEQGHPSLCGRLVAPGELSAEEVARYLSACDLLLQPYPDGAGTRRGTLMTGLALGMPIMTTEGSLSEPLWRESGAVALAPSGQVGEMIEIVEKLLSEKETRAELGRRGRKLYQERFSWERTIETLRG